MQRIFTAGSELEAHEARLFLESRGVRAFVDGESAAFPNFPFTRGSAPGVVVDDADAEQAQHLLADFPDNQRPPQLTGSWKCPKCGEKCGPNFDFCWNCEQPRRASDELPNDGEAPSFGIPIQPSVDAATDTTEAEMSVASSIAGTTSRRELWLEVLVALSVSWLPHFAFSILSRIWTIQRSKWSFAGENLWQIVNVASISIVILYLIHRGDTNWQTHGIRKLRLGIDLATGILIWFVSIIAVWVVYLLASPLIHSIQRGSWAKSTYEFQSPANWFDYVVLVLLGLSVGFCEELTMRGYLIPRAEQLVGSTATAVFVSSFLFASYHIYQGVGAAFLVLIVGLVYGTMFCRLRRLWPLVIAHAITDVVALGVR